jgi:EAL domain-containing protein (putative c-di-GMP-specific phosphodiesterase class I)
VLNSIIKDPSLIYLEYQPKINLKTEQLIGCEALVRCLHYQTGKPVKPYVFIKLAETTGQMIEISEVILRQAVQFIQRIQRIGGLGDRRVKVAVNVSGVQFNMLGIGLVGTIKEVVDAARIDPAWLEVELTESTLMGDPKSVKDKFDEMKALGMSIALDDFGTGYSSFSSLQDFPIDTLKIDKSFVDGASVDERKGKILRAIVTMAKELGIDTVAEGAEQMSDIDLLRKLECSIVQGYYYRPPLSADEFIGLIEENGPVQPRSLLIGR